MIIILWCTTTILLYGRQPVAAQPEETARLQQKITELEKRLERIESFFKIDHEPYDPQKAEKYGWQNKKNWRKLKIGMTESEVQKILGEPTKVISGVKTLWYYPSIYSGYISFDQKGQISGWNEP